MCVYIYIYNFTKAPGASTVKRCLRVFSSWNQESLYHSYPDIYIYIYICIYTPMLYLQLHGDFAPKDRSVQVVGEDEQSWRDTPTQQSHIIQIPVPFSPKDFSPHWLDWIKDPALAQGIKIGSA